MLNKQPIFFTYYAEFQTWKTIQVFVVLSLGVFYNNNNII